MVPAVLFTLFRQLPVPVMEPAGLATVDRFPVTRFHTDHATSPVVSPEKGCAYYSILVDEQDTAQQYSVYVQSPEGAWRSIAGGGLPP